MAAERAIQSVEAAEIRLCSTYHSWLWCISAQVDSEDENIAWMIYALSRMILLDQVNSG